MESYLGLQASALNGQRAALFRVRTAVADVYMSVSRSNYGNEERAVVEVDCTRLLKLWRDGPRSSTPGSQTERRRPGAPTRASNWRPRVSASASKIPCRLRKSDARRAPPYRTLHLRMV